MDLRWIFYHLLSMPTNKSKWHYINIVSNLCSPTKYFIFFAYVYLFIIFNVISNDPVKKSIFLKTCLCNQQTSGPVWAVYLHPQQGAMFGHKCIQRKVCRSTAEHSMAYCISFVKCHVFDIITEIYLKHPLHTCFKTNENPLLGISVKCFFSTKKFNHICSLSLTGKV